MFLGARAHNFSVAQERVSVTSKRRQCSCRTCQTVYCGATTPSSTSEPRSLCRKLGLPVSVGSRRAQGGLRVWFCRQAATEPRFASGLYGAGLARSGIASKIKALTVSPSASDLLFLQLINHRYEHASTVLTSNKGFEGGVRSSAMRLWRNPNRPAHTSLPRDQPPSRVVNAAAHKST